MNEPPFDPGPSADVLTRTCGRTARTTKHGAPYTLVCGLGADHPQRLCMDIDEAVPFVPDGHAAIPAPWDHGRSLPCDARCVCPVHGTPLLYWPLGDEHACRDLGCVYGHGMTRRGASR